MKSGAGFGAGCQHGHKLEAWVAHCPGLKVVMPATPADAKGVAQICHPGSEPRQIHQRHDVLLRAGPDP